MSIWISYPSIVSVNRQTPSYTCSEPQTSKGTSAVQLPVGSHACKCKHLMTKLKNDNKNQTALGVDLYLLGQKGFYLAKIDYKSG